MLSDLQTVHTQVNNWCIQSHFFLYCYTNCIKPAEKLLKTPDVNVWTQLCIHNCRLTAPSHLHVFTSSQQHQRDLSVFPWRLLVLHALIALICSPAVINNQVPSPSFAVLHLQISAANRAAQSISTNRNLSAFLYKTFRVSQLLQLKGALDQLIISLHNACQFGNRLKLIQVINQTKCQICCSFLLI